MPAENLPHALEIWDNAARLALPIWLKAWLGLLAVTFLSSAFFVRHDRLLRRECRPRVRVFFRCSHPEVRIGPNGGSPTAYPKPSAAPTGRGEGDGAGFDRVGDAVGEEESR